MRRLAVLLSLAAMAGSSSPSLAAPTAADTYYPLAKGHKWTYAIDYSEDTDVVHEVSGVEKVGETECYIVEHKTVSAALGTRMMRKEWLASNADGVLIHKVQRGRSEMDVEKPFFKVKHVMKKDEEWKGEAKGTENPPQYTIRVEEEVDVEVPAGKYKAWKVHLRVESGLRHSAEGTEWYAKNVGLVKSEITIRAGGEDFKLVSELKKFETGK